MACLRGNFPLQCGIGAQRLGEKHQLSGANFLPVGTGISMSSPFKVQLPSVILKNVAYKIRAINVEEYGSDENVDGLRWNFDCGRREVVTGLIGASLSVIGEDALAADVPGALNRYIKRKKLDPLETYVPTILLAQSQFQEVDGRLDGETSKLADARSLLRNGPAASLRTDIRAVAQYAAESGNDGGASAAVDQCLSALEDLDGLLLRASRSQSAPVEKMRKRLSTAVTAIDRLLATVPAAILEKGKAVAKAYKESD